MFRNFVFIIIALMLLSAAGIYAQAAAAKGKPIVAETYKTEDPSKVVKKIDKKKTKAVHVTSAKRITAVRPSK